MRRAQACVKSDLCGGVIRDVINCRSACVCVSGMEGGSADATQRQVSGKHPGFTVGILL